ncbi:MAG: hypothetical protein COV72_04045 [Candidatus Omnitrophica bacterium CG11_big_fil_rev_8_21_14_0_20_42_13]|uniref:UPF0033 domain-containing protein n=1 Tax=Candidatus Ghiorseimicrobium undicola TaxID=1974746 RepID=A0A2H0M0K4_9BACT|nr:MAG: hypothetical protein COV72_04045 [Candidatus Omnitrophica bacterium CG11_big_fil_rev_8_21_14_0_20_42_13]
MDQSFNFPKQSPETAGKDISDKKGNVLDLKGTPCPINYVKAKLFLENLEAGDNLQIILDEGEPIKNVPESLKNDGHKILSIEKTGEFYKVTVKKG